MIDFFEIGCIRSMLIEILDAKGQLVRRYSSEEKAPL